jgi:NAD-dependent SIR2 family protein deacetylase
MDEADCVECGERFEFDHVTDDGPPRTFTRHQRVIYCECCGPELTIHGVRWSEERDVCDDCSPTTEDF